MQDTIGLSQRAKELKSSVTLAVTARVGQLKEAGKDVIGFGAGEPDFDTPEAIKEAAIESLKGGATHYMPVAGPGAAREAVAEKLGRENGVSCTADEVLITTGAKHAVYLGMQALADPGDEVIVPTPAWVSYPPIVELCGAKVVEVPGAVENDFKITPEQLEEAITDKTKVMLFNSPSNPCGTMYSPEEIRGLAEVIARHERVVLISDEIYEHLIYGPTAHLSPGSIEAIADRVVTVNGLSKAYAMTGWRVGYASAPGVAVSREGGRSVLAKAMAKLQGQMTSHITSFCYAALVEALRHGGKKVEEMRGVFARRAELIYALVRKMPGVACPKPTGAFYVFPDISAYFGKTTGDGRKVDSALGFAEALLEEALVAVVPGEDFGECARKHVRLSFACSEADIERGCGRIAEWLGTLR